MKMYWIDILGFPRINYVEVANRIMEVQDLPSPPSLVFASTTMRASQTVLEGEQLDDERVGA